MVPLALKSILEKLGRFTSGDKERGGCMVCGICCELYGPTVKADADDLARWEVEGRDDIIGWALAEGEARPDGCPFLAKSATGGGYCSIQPTKPAMCRAYPTDAHDRKCLMRVKHENGAKQE